MKMLKWIAFCTVFSAGLGFYFFQKVQAQNEVPPLLIFGLKDKLKGNVIALQTDAQIVAWCDFEKTIIRTNTNVLCVYNGANDTKTT